MWYCAGVVPKVSVCLLAYNHAKTLSDALESILEQDLEDFECIVSDDCSSDGSWELIQAFARRDARVRGVRTPRNLGMAGNANFAARHARAPYIALLHHDDVCRRDLLRRWTDVADRHPSVAFVSNGYEMDGASPRVDLHAFAERTDGRRALEEMFFPSWGCPVRGTALVRTRCWQEVGGIREQYGLIADVDLWMRLAARWDVGYVREPLIRVRHEPPTDYPAGYSGWSWIRFRLLYAIHGDNRDAYYATGPRRVVERLKYRLRVSADECYWLLYALAKRRPDILATSEQVANPYELAAVRAVREALQLAAQQPAVRRALQVAGASRAKSAR